MRTPTELIEELDAEATKFKIVVLVVMFQESETVLIRSDRGNRLTALATALSRGGEAVGFIGVKDEGKSVSFYRRVLLEHEGKELFSEYLASITDEITEILCREEYQFSAEWVN